MKQLKQYKNKRVFVTGHTGFKGAWFLTILHELGANIKGYALAPDQPYGVYNAIHASRFCVSILDDIRDQDRLEKELLSFEPDFVFHLAAQPLVRQSYLEPSETFDVNVLGTAYLLDAVRKLPNACQIVVITTDKVYKNKEQDAAYKESDELGGYDPYSTSKACVELLVESYRNSFFNRQSFSEHKKSVVTARAGNVIGGGDFAKDRIIPDLVRSLQLNQDLNLRNPNAVRPWQHVLEPLVGYLQLGLFLEQHPLSYSTAYNFGPLPNDHLTVEELTKEAIQIWGKGSYNISKHDNLHETHLLKLDITLARQDLAWLPKYNAVEAIKKTLNWYKDSDKANITILQVQEYLKD